MTPEQKAQLEIVRQVWPEMAEKIEAELAAVTAAGGLEAASKLKIDIGIRYRLEKFDGDVSPGKQPFEVIERQDKIGE